MLKGRYTIVKIHEKVNVFKLIFSAIGALGGLILTIVSLALGFSESNYVFDKGIFDLKFWRNTYGADFYTDIQNNLADAAEIFFDIRQILFVGAICFGLAMLGYFGMTFFKMLPDVVQTKAQITDDETELADSETSQE